MTGLVKYTGVAIAEVFSAIGAPGGSTIQAALDGYEARQVSSAREILISELRDDSKADWQVANEDALLGAIHRFRKAALEGSAKHNLRLLARSIRRTVLAGDTTADRFFLYAGRLADLSRTECWLLGTLHAICCSTRAVYGKTSDAEGSQKAWDELKAAAIPKFLDSERHLTSALAALMRTGFVLQMTSIDLALSGYETSPLMDDLVQIIDAREFESIAAEL